MPFKIIKQCRVAFKKWIKKDIWKVSSFQDDSFKGRLAKFTRIIIIIFQGVVSNKIPSHAAALSYYSLMSLGPLIALIIMISGFILQGQSETLATKTLSKVLVFMAPSASEFHKAQIATEEDLSKALQEHKRQSAPISEAEFNQELLNLIDRLVKSARSGTVGIVGTLVLVLISIQLIVTIEKTLNGIWGVRQGRTIVQRIFAYWTLISLGAVIGLASMTVFSAATLQSIFGKIPLGQELLSIAPGLAPLASFMVIVFILAMFYRFIPHTTVMWKSAFLGGFIVACLLSINNYLSFLYVSNALQNKSLYGSIGIIPVLMFGLFVFWVIVLLGGQISYSVQNAKSLIHLKAWSHVSKKTHEILCLTIYLIIARRFEACEKSPSVMELSDATEVPGQVLNGSLSQLSDIHLISAIKVEEEGESITRYQPSRPLDKVFLSDFVVRYDCQGSHEEQLAIFNRPDPLVETYLKIKKEALIKKPFNQTIKELIQATSSAS